jgi:hypothetical protein
MVVKFKGVLKGYVRVLFKTAFIMDKNEMQDQIYLIKVGQSIITTCIANYENAYIYIYVGYIMNLAYTLFCSLSKQLAVQVLTHPRHTYDYEVGAFCFSASPFWR